MMYGLHFWMPGCVFLVSEVLKAQSRWKSWRDWGSQSHASPARHLIFRFGRWWDWGVRSAAELREECRCPAAWPCCARAQVTDAHPCLHRTTCLGVRKLHLNKHGSKAMCMSLVFRHLPVGRCVYMWVSLLPKIFYVETV